MAIKKIAMKRGKYTEGANFTALREIKLLQELKHEYIIEVSTCLLWNVACFSCTLHPQKYAMRSIVHEYCTKFNEMYP